MRCAWPNVKSFAMAVSPQNNYSLKQYDDYGRWLIGLKKELELKLQASSSNEFVLIYFYIILICFWDNYNLQQISRQADICKH